MNQVEQKSNTRSKLVFLFVVVALAIVSSVCMAWYSQATLDKRMLDNQLLLQQHAGGFIPAENELEVFGSRFISLELVIDASFSSSKLVIFDDGLIRYTEPADGAPVVSDQGYAGLEAVQEILDAAENQGVFDLPSSQQSVSDPTDGSTYTLRISADPETLFGDVLFAEVSCYEFVCEESFLQVAEMIRILWGKKILEVGV